MKGKYVGVVFAKRAAGGGIAAKNSRTEWPSEGDRKRKGGVWKPERRSVNKRRYVTAYKKVGAKAPSRVAPQEHRSCPGNGTGSFCFYGTRRWIFSRRKKAVLRSSPQRYCPLRAASAEQTQGGSAHDPKVETMVNGGETLCRSDPPSTIVKRKEISSWNRFRIKFI